MNLFYNYNNKQVTTNMAFPCYLILSNLNTTDLLNNLIVHIFNSGERISIYSYFLWKLERKNYWKLCQF